MIAAILAAGRGTRMRDFSDHWPKPALPVCNKPLLQYQIEMMREVGIREILIVIGHLGHEIAQVFGDGSSLGVHIKYVEQNQTLGIANALGQLEPHVSSPLFLLLGDIFFVADDLAIMVDAMKERKAGAVLAVKHEADPEAIKRNFTILLRDDGSVRRVIEKPRHSTTNIKGCGLYLFDLPVFDAVRRTPRTAMRDEYEITDTIQIMIDDGLLVYPADIVKWDMNLSYPPDLLECNLYQLERLGETRVIGDSVTIDSGATVENAVLGDRVVVQHPIRISNSLVFPDTVINSKHDIDRFILTPRHQIDCRTFT